MDPRIDEVLQFWFAPPPEGEERPSGVELWFQGGAASDRLVRSRFGALLQQAKSGKLDGWASTPRGRLALIVVLDQFSRMVHRDTPEAFAADEKALALCFDGLDDGMDKKLSAPERAFFYMPAMHAEDVDAQLASVEVFDELAQAAPPEHRALCQSFLRHAEKHRDVVERFERFPHRNAILGRTSSADEAAFLTQTGESL